MTSRHGLEIRAATAADAPDLAALLAEAGAPMEPRLLAERLAALRAGAATALVAVQWGPPSGLVVLHWFPTLGPESPVARITTLLVAGEDRRRGIGRLLLKGAAQAARLAGCARMEVLADAAAPGLAEFCRATGFAAAGEGFVRPLRRQG